ncbi:arsenate reductase family protein [Bacillus daqingensis]|uniref:Arsenate reductase family protein n=1 Tax=Bacillus daqingensis TaxID=872396 RepID=A0ABV9NXQ7_9BACI
MSVTFYHYPKCTTCKKAKKWLENEGVALEEVHIVEHPPSKDELKKLHEQSGLPLKRFFNTSGQKYRELGLKDKLGDMPEEEQLELLASDGMLIKRPIAAKDGHVTVGFREADYEKTWK